MSLIPVLYCNFENKDNKYLGVSKIVTRSDVMDVRLEVNVEN